MLTDKEIIAAKRYAVRELTKKLQTIVLYDVFNEDILLKWYQEFYTEFERQLEWSKYQEKRLEDTEH